MQEDIVFKLDKENIAHITLNRPHVHNALDENMIQRLTDLFQNLHNHSTVKALILQGNGKSFCAGADISWMERTLHLSAEENRAESHKLSHMLHLLDTLPIPTLAYVHGSIMGGGIGLLACSDIVLSDNLSSFCFSEIKIGLVPAIISPYVMRTIGYRQAQRYFLTAEKFNASQAFQMGLVHEIVEEHNIENRLDLFVHDILNGGPMAIRLTKKLIHEIGQDISETLCSKTADLNAHIRESKEGREGINAFLEKRTPSWISKKSSHD